MAFSGTQTTALAPYGTTGQPQSFTAKATAAGRPAVPRLTLLYPYGTSGPYREFTAKAEGAARVSRLPLLGVG